MTARAKRKAQKANLHLSARHSASPFTHSTAAELKQSPSSSLSLRRFSTCTASFRLYFVCVRFILTFQTCKVFGLLTSIARKTRLARENTAKPLFKKKQKQQQIPHLFEPFKRDGKLHISSIGEQYFTDMGGPQHSVQSD